MPAGVKKKKTTLFRRYEKVIGVLFKYGFEDIVTHTSFKRFIPKTGRLAPFRGGRSVLKFSRYERIRMVCEELGTTFIKFAQIASNRPDVLPEELISELTKFQDNALLVPKEEIRARLEKEYKKPLDEIFESIDYNPVASASIAQVHRAYLIGGKEVALKVQRPGIGETIELDIEILHRLASMVERYFPQYSSYQPVELVNMFEKSIRKELKFSMEAANMERFYKNFKGNENIYVPTVYPKLTTDRVLCMEFINGYKVTDDSIWEKAGITGPELALKGINLYFEQIFDHGFFHADPHPGNFFVLPNQKVCFIDYGMMGTIVESDKELLAKLLLSVNDQDMEGLKKSLMRFSWEEHSIDEKALEYDIAEFFSDYSSITLDEIESNEVIAGLNSLFFDYKIRIPSNLLLLLKALVIIEGVGLTLDPKYNIIKNIEPFVRRLLARKFSPRVLTRNAIRSLGDLATLVNNIPEDVEDIIQKIKRGKLHVEFEHKGLEGLYNKMEVVSNRISFTLVLAALILGSALIVIADLPPYIYGMPAIGFFGFIISGILALRLLFSIMKHGNF